MWNGRIDVEYYKVEVSDSEWNPVPFITNERTFRLKYMERKDIEVFIPSLNEQIAIAKIFDQVDEEIAVREAHLNSLNEQKKGLMQQLLTGQKRVKV